jgi:Alw26I/Eco31I/Esp3I family type II restriction endonuclease
MTKKEKVYSKEFLEYQKFIIAHRVYEGMPMPSSESLGIPWVSPATGNLGKARLAWWNKKKLELEKQGVLLRDQKISDVARVIHPTKRKPCQTCGKILSIEYVYLNANGIKKFLKIFPLIAVNEFAEISVVVKMIAGKYGEKGLYRLCNEFKLSSVTSNEALIESVFRKEMISFLSPGVMSNAPDRLDGFHSYNKCCRAKEDKGRAKENLSKYGEDRRAYENWADGDWKAASWLMKEFTKNNISADHIGPISLGFCHTPVFAPMTKQENSAKNNRLRFADVKKLLDLEAAGHQIISWHTKLVWDRLKKNVNNDTEALAMSKVLRKHLHRVLLVLNELKERGNEEFLKSLLNPKYAFYSIEFIGFNPATGQYKELIKTKGELKQYSNNAERYIRKAFESLEQYKLKENRKLADIGAAELKTLVEETESAMERFGSARAKLVLQKGLGELPLD